MPLKRNEHWATRDLHAFLLAHAHDPFVWGQNDCCLFPANAIKAFTGTDLATAFRGKYSDQASAFALIKSVTGGSTVADAAAWCATQAGLTEWPHPRRAGAGDLVVVATATAEGDGMTAGIVHCNYRHIVTASESGLVRLPISKVMRAWQV